MKNNLIILVIMVSALFLFSCGSPDSKLSNEEFIKIEVDKMLKELPIKIDEYTTWSDIQAGKDEVNLIYDVAGVSADDFNDSMISQVKAQILKGLKADSKLWPVFERNITVKYCFYDEEEYEIFQAAVTRDDIGI